MKGLDTLIINMAMVCLILGIGSCTAKQIIGAKVEFLKLQEIERALEDHGQDHRASH